MTISSTTIHLHPITRYFFQNSSFPLNEQDGSVQERMARLKEEYSIHGKRISLDAAIICHLHKHPHLMILNFGGTFYKLPGDSIPPLSTTTTSSTNNNEKETLIGFIKNIFYPDESLVDSQQLLQDNIQIGDVIQTLYRPDFNQTLYPYPPPHIKNIKEIRRIYMVTLSPDLPIVVPSNTQLLAVPLFELHDDHEAKFGKHLAALPQILSRYEFKYL